MVASSTSKSNDFPQLQQDLLQQEWQRRLAARAEEVKQDEREYLASIVRHALTYRGL